MISRAFTAFFAAFLLTSCIGSGLSCEKLSLKNKDLEWFSSFEVDDMLIFRSDSNNVDTFLTTYSAAYYLECNPIEISKYQRQSYYLKLDLVNREIEGVSDYNSEEVQIIFTQIDEFTCEKCFSVFDASYCSDSISQGLFFENGMGSAYLKEPYLESFIWKKDSGLVSYTTFLGETYRGIPSNYR